MGIQTQFAERRKDKRVKVKDPAYTIMFYSPDMAGQITDISKSGAAVRCVKNGASSAGEISGLDIFKTDFSFHIFNISAKIISDLEVIDKTFLGSKQLRRCGIQFQDLSQSQISQLENFLQDLPSDR